MKNRKSILLVVLLLAVGFAAVSTTLYINGSTNINPNQNDFNVYYSDAYVNGVQDKGVITDDTHIVFETELSALGEKYVLDYEVANGSKNYDAELEMECTEGNEYLTVTNEFDDETILEAKDLREGKLTLELKKSNAGEDIDVTIMCTISANAIERTELNENEIATNTTYIIEGNYVSETGTAIANANLVIFSDTPHYVTTDENGYLFYNGLEKGKHEIYYVEDTLENIKSMTKVEIILSSTANSIFYTTDSGNISFSNNSILKNINIVDNIKYCDSLINKEWIFDYTGNSQYFVTVCDGKYKVELWGAQGIGNNGGLGGYVSGKIDLNNGKNFIVTIEKDGGNVDIRLTPSVLSRIIVAGSGGGELNYVECNHGNDIVKGADAGGLFGYNGTSGLQGTAMIREAQGGNQTFGGLYGYGNEYANIGNSGGFGYRGTISNISGSGGSGYYGGGSSGRSYCNGGSGGGGSSFISGHTGCDAISSDSTENNIIHTGQPNHYSGYVFTDTIMVDGQGYNWTTSKGEYTGMPSYDGTTTMTGNAGNGYAKITYLGTN